MSKTGAGKREVSSSGEGLDSEEETRETRLVFLKDHEVSLLSLLEVCETKRTSQGQS